MTREELTREELIVLDALRSVSGSDRTDTREAEIFNDVLCRVLKCHKKVVGETEGEK